MASYTGPIYLGIIKDQQANISDGQDTAHFSGIFKHQNELSKQYEISRIGVEKEGSHCKCNAFFLGFFALAAAVGAAWLLVYHCQDGGLIPALCLCTISMSFLVAIAVTSILSFKHQKSLENQLVTQIQGHVHLGEILQAMEEPHVTASTIKTVVGGLEADQKRAFLQSVYYTSPEELDPVQQKIFKALKADPKLLCLIQEKGSDFALTVLRYAEPHCADELLDCLIDTITYSKRKVTDEVIHTFITLINDKGRTFALRVLSKNGKGKEFSTTLLVGLIRIIKDPKSPEEAAQLAHHPYEIKRYITSLSTSKQDIYKRAFLQYTAPDTPDHLVKELVDLPQSEADALIFARHPKSCRWKGDQFGLLMLNLLPPDYDLDLLRHLIPYPTTKSAAQIIRRHPKACSRIISELTSINKKKSADGCSLLTSQYVLSPDQTGVDQPNVDVPAFAYYLAHIPSESFTLERIYGYFLVMTIPEKTLFLQELNDACTNSEARTRSDAIVGYIVQHWWTPKVVNELCLKSQALLSEFANWSTQVSEFVFGSDFDTDNCLIYNSFIVRYHSPLFSGKHAAACLNQRPDAANIYIKWLIQKECPSFFIVIMANSPEILAQVLCCTERFKELDVIEKMNHAPKLIANMTGEQRTLFDTKYFELFLPHYEKMVFDHCVISKELERQLLKQINFIDQHHKWVAKNPTLAKRYFELFMDAELTGSYLLFRLMRHYPALFIPFQVVFNRTEAVIPTFRLIKLSPVFERMINSGLRESQNRIIRLKDLPCEEVERSFIRYLKDGVIKDDEENILALAHLAQCYEISHLSNLCTQLIETNLSDTNLEVVLEAALRYQLWDIRLVCLIYISKNSTSLFITNLVKNPRLDESMKQFLNYGINCENQGIAISFSNKSVDVKKSEQFGRYRVYRKPKRCVKLEKFLSIEDLDELNQLILPEDWSIKTHSQGFQFVLSSLKADRQDFLAIFLQTLRPVQNIDGGLLDSTFEERLILYKLALQHKKIPLATTYLRSFTFHLNLNNLPHAIQEAQKYQLTDLICLCLAFLSNKKALTTAKLSLSKLQDRLENPEAKNILKLGLRCAELKIRVLYEPGQHSLLIRDIKRNSDEEVLKTLFELHRIIKITHLDVESPIFTRTLQSEMKYSGVNIRTILYDWKVRRSYFTLFYYEAV